MIVTVTCNPAVDVTYRVDRLTPGEVHRVARAEERPGGKGVNVARVLHQLGDEVVATGLADASFGPRLEAIGVPASFVTALPAVRRTVVVHADDSTTGLWEPGAAPRDLRGAEVELLERVAALLTNASGLVVSGSQPGGFEPGLSARVAALAHDRGLPVLVDVDGPPLPAALAAGGAVLTPNLDELVRLLSLPLRPDSLDVAAEARTLARLNRAPVVVTLGSAGMIASDGERCWHAVAPQVEGNPTGAGDAAAAAVMRGLVAGEPWPVILAEAVALSAAAVLAPVAGEVDLEQYRKWRVAVRAHVVDTLITRR